MWLGLWGLTPGLLRNGVGSLGLLAGVAILAMGLLFAWIRQRTCDSFPVKAKL